MINAEIKLAASKNAAKKSGSPALRRQNSEIRQPSLGIFRASLKLLLFWFYDHAIADRTVAILLIPLVTVVLAGVWPLALLCQGRPFLYGAKRMKSSDQEFRLWKIRTMHPKCGAALSVMGGDQLPRVTKLGRMLRCARLDEIPQVFNVLIGDIRFIGPRPPLRKYVELYPDIYAQVLRGKPGITGLATVLLHRRERRLLEACKSAAETDELYRRACIPIKARLDILYLRRRSFWLDAFVIYRTFAGLLPESFRQTVPKFAVSKKSRGSDSGLSSGLKIDSKAA